MVTGLRIIKRNQIIHLQIQEGKLLPFGYIDIPTVRWVPVDNFKISDNGAIDGRDYHTLKYEDRTIALDELRSLKDEEVLTGKSMLLL